MSPPSPSIDPVSPFIHCCCLHPRLTTCTTGSSLPLVGSDRPLLDLDSYRCIHPPSPGSGYTPLDLVARCRITVDPPPLELVKPTSNPPAPATPAAGPCWWNAWRLRCRPSPPKRTPSVTGVHAWASAARARATHAAVTPPPELEWRHEERGGEPRWSTEGEGKGEVASLESATHMR